MSPSSTLRRTASVLAITAVAGVAALAGTASGAEVEKTKVLTPGATIPVDFPGYKEPANNRLKANYRVVVVKAEVARDERATTTLSAPARFHLVTLGIGNGNQLGLRAENDYVGKRSVRLTLFANRAKVKAGEDARGHIYLLARRG